MNQTIAMVTLGALLLGGIIGYLIGQETDHHEPMMHQSDRNGVNEKSSNADSHDMHNMHAMTATSEKTFLEGMIPHHEEAVKTAKEVLARGGTTPEIRSLVTSIITAQEAEIANMKEWYNAWYGTPYQESGTYTPMMRDLAALSAKDLDRAFLEDMIMHHMGALMMAHSIQNETEHTELSQLVEAIIETQTAEIQTMRSLLETL